MKIYEKPKAPYLIRLQIKKRGENTEFLTLYETTMVDVKEFLEKILEPHTTTSKEHPRTSIYIREATGSVNGRNISVSFFDLTTKQTLDLIVKNCE